MFSQIREEDGGVGLLDSGVGLIEIGDWLEVLDGAFVGESVDLHVGMITLSLEVVLPTEVENTTMSCESIKERVA